LYRLKLFTEVSRTEERPAFADKAYTKPAENAYTNDARCTGTPQRYAGVEINSRAASKKSCTKRKEGDTELGKEKEPIDGIG